MWWGAKILGTVERAGSHEATIEDVKDAKNGGTAHNDGVSSTLPFHTSRHAGTGLERPVIGTMSSALHSGCEANQRPSRREAFDILSS